MPTLYKITLHNKEKTEHKKDLNLEQAMNFKIENLMGITLQGGGDKFKFSIESYEVSEDYFFSLLNVSQEERNRLLIEFKKTITQSQQHDIDFGYKSIKWRKILGWHIEITKTHEQESVFSVEMLKKKRQDEIKKELRTFISSYHDELFTFISNKYETSLQEFDSIFNTILK
jgi:hypothetical protein